MPLGFSPGHFSVSGSNRLGKILRTKGGFSRAAEYPIGEGWATFSQRCSVFFRQDKESPGAKAQILLELYGPTKVVP
jgi:hypothetical protein